MKPDCTHLNLPAPDAACGPKPAGQQGAVPLQGASDALVHQLHMHQVELHAQAEALHDIQHELKESRDRYLSLFEHAPTAYLLLDEKGRIAEQGRHEQLLALAAPLRKNNYGLYLERLLQDRVIGGRP